MTIDPALQALIGELGQQMGLGDLSLDEQGFCALRFDEKLVINLQYWADDEQLLLFADLGPSAIGVQLYSNLLRANLFWRATLGATLSLSEDDPPHVILALQQPWQPLDAAQLNASLERFVNTVEDWSEVVENTGTDSKLADDTPLSPTMGMVRV